MIPHPTVENLLREHGTTAEGRQAAREALIEATLVEARREATLYGLSRNCEEALRRGVKPEQHWCKNDGSNCLCQCHDPKMRDGPG